MAQVVVGELLVRSLHVHAGDRVLDVAGGAGNTAHSRATSSMRTPPRDLGAELTASLWLSLIGGLTSYRALSNWLSPWILVPTFMLTPIFQILFFVYVGRRAGAGSDSFFLIGNAVLYAAIPCLFAMDSTISGE